MEDFSFQFSYRVGVADINYGGHVANSAVLNFFQDARIAYLATLGPYSEIDLGGCGIIMPEANIFFRQEMFLGEQLEIGVRSTGLKRSSWTMEYRIERDGTLTAEGQTALVCFNYETRKPCRMPNEFRMSLTTFEGL
ncbi:acyl-CoA thioester hydrolase, YbgC/YbaW family [Desulfuromusa kysingii]|uniref:Acyl-CoA thioester hydrolase, YbgC/YbaW family n=1 Tax=Desulfuromusa kysingii TaxID=37625 RepID=A0A1H3YEG9_9BACT|nr:thioesterase family protein [Desulfuromusa kysingii]SEA09999.1 acyl-CoA thioester hydrolase, YbgC/YbaW family [Desulfuromusa kysingii]